MLVDATMAQYLLLKDMSRHADNTNVSLLDLHLRVGPDASTSTGTVGGPPHHQRRRGLVPGHSARRPPRPRWSLGPLRQRRRQRQFLRTGVVFQGDANTEAFEESPASGATEGAPPADPCRRGGSSVSWINFSRGSMSMDHMTILGVKGSGHGLTGPSGPIFSSESHQCRLMSWVCFSENVVDFDKSNHPLMILVYTARGM